MMKTYAKQYAYLLFILIIDLKSLLIGNSQNSSQSFRLQIKDLMSSIGYSFGKYLLEYFLIEKRRFLQKTKYQGNEKTLTDILVLNYMISRF